MENPPPLQNTHILKQGEEKRLDDLFNNFSRNEVNQMKFSDFLLFAIDRSLISPKIGFSHLFELILDCLGPNHEFEQYKDKALGFQKERTLNKSQFNFLLVQLSKWIYHTEINHLEKLLQDILAEKTIATKDSIQTNRTPFVDEVTKRILTEQSIAVLCDFEEELRSCFVTYMSENYRKNKLLLKWEELALDNKKMTTYAFAKFLNDSQIVPHSMSPELIQDIMSKMVPQGNPMENQFYIKHRVIQIFDKDIDKKFFKNVLGFRSNEELNTEDFPNINKKVYERLNNYYTDLEEEEKQFYEEEQFDHQEEPLKQPLELVADLQQNEIFNVEALQIEIPDLLQLIKKDLPPIPDPPSQLQENVMPYKDDKFDPKRKDKVVIGDRLPDPPPDKNKQQKPKPPKKKQLKKGEKPPRPIIYAGFPPPDPQLQYNHLESLNNKLVYGEKQLSNIQRGDMSSIEVIPVIIEEILYPPQCLQEVRCLVESAINSYNQSNFIFALKCFDDARLKWQKALGKDIGDNILLFFEYSKASIYASAGRDDYALYWYFQCKNLSDKLAYNNPDRSLAYCGLGSVLYNMEEYTLALRSFLKAREIREKLHGVEHIDTATTYNNLGCTMFMIERNQEAHAYFKVAHAIFEAELGPFHNRTMTAGRNIKKCEQGFFQNIPAFKTLWETYENDPFKKTKKKKKKKK